LEEEESYLPALGFLFGNLNPETGELEDESILGPDSAEQIRGLGLMGLELDDDWGIAAGAESDSKDLDADAEEAEEELPTPIPVSPITTQEDSLAVAAKSVFVALAPMKRKSTDSVVPEAKSIKLDEEYDYDSDAGNYDSYSNRQEGNEAILAYGDNDDEAGPSSASLILSEAVENMSDLMAINVGHI
jgi:hypothetical protein